MGSAVSSGPIFRFGLFEADVARNTLTRKGVRVKIQDQPFRVLILLLGNAGEIVTREELRQKLWPEGTYVDFEGSLNVILKKVRAAIDDDFENPRFIETVPRRGYRFIAPVAVEQPTPIGQDPEPGDAEFFQATNYAIPSVPQKKGKVDGRVGLRGMHAPAGGLVVYAEGSAHPTGHAESHRGSAVFQ